MKKAKRAGKRPGGFPRPGLPPGLLVFPIVALILILFSGGTAIAANPDISDFTRNLSGVNPAGQTWDDYNSEVAVSGNYVHVVWFSRRSDWDRARICYTRSTDGGATFEDYRVLHVVNTATKNILSEPELRMLAADGANVYVAFSRYEAATDTRSWHYNLIYLRSTDNGATFSTPKVLFAGKDIWHIEQVRIAADSGKLTIGFNYFANWYNNYSMRVLNSTDGGGTFSRSVAGRSDKYSGTLEDLKRVGDDVYLLYRWVLEPVYYGNFQAILNCAASNNGGASFKTSRMTTRATDGRYYTYGLHDEHYSPNIAVAGDRVHVVWTQNGTAYDSNNIKLFLRSSTDRGMSFGPPRLLATNGVGIGDMQLGCETVSAMGDRVYAAFLTTDSRVYLRRSTDGGASLLRRQELTLPGIDYLSAGWWPLVQADPRSADGSEVHVLWNPATYLRSSDGGATFVRQGMLRAGYGNGPERPSWALGADGEIHVTLEGAYATASSGGYGDSDIFYRKWPTGPELADPSGTPMALRLAGVYNEYYDTMQVAASDSLNFKAAFTVEAWIKPARDADTSGYFVFKADPGSGGAWGSYMLGQWRSGQLDARITTTDGGFVLTDGPVIPNDQWTHVAMTYASAMDGDNFKIYVNGELVGKMRATGKLLTGGGLLFVGADDSNHYFSEIQVRELALWKASRSRASILADMTSPPAGDEASLSAYYDFQNTTRDASPNGNHGMLMFKESFVAP